MDIPNSYRPLHEALDSSGRLFLHAFLRTPYAHRIQEPILSHGTPIEWHHFLTSFMHAYRDIPLGWFNDIDKVFLSGFYVKDWSVDFVQRYSPPYWNILGGASLEKWYLDHDTLHSYIFPKEGLYPHFQKVLELLTAPYEPWNCYVRSFTMDYNGYHVFHLDAADEILPSPTHCEYFLKWYHSLSDAYKKSYKDLCVLKIIDPFCCYHVTQGINNGAVIFEDLQENHYGTTH